MSFTSCLASGAAALVFPTTMVPPVPIGQDVEVAVREKKVPFMTAIARNIAPGSTAGLPVSLGENLVSSGEVPSGR
jgi:indoleacetamide hydrolase